MLADAVSDVLEKRPKYVYDRHVMREKRTKDEIGIHAVRGGTIVGEHEILFAGRDEVLTLSHTAMSKEVFATGKDQCGSVFVRPSKWTLQYGRSGFRDGWAVK